MTTTTPPTREWTHDPPPRSGPPRHAFTWSEGLFSMIACCWASALGTLSGWLALMTYATGGGPRPGLALLAIAVTALLAITPLVVALTRAHE